MCNFGIMKRLLTFLFILYSLHSFSQTSLPTGSKAYGNTTYLAPNGLLWYGVPGTLGYRSVYTAFKVDSLIANNALTGIPTRIPYFGSDGKLTNSNDLKYDAATKVLTNTTGITLGPTSSLLSGAVTIGNNGKLDIRGNISAIQLFNSLDVLGLRISETEIKQPVFNKSIGFSADGILLPETPTTSTTDYDIVTWDRTNKALKKIDPSILALDANVVHKTGDEPVAGSKTFSSTILNTAAGASFYAGAGNFVRSGAVGNKGFAVHTNDVPRVMFQTDNIAETGSDAGSNALIRVWNDAGNTSIDGLKVMRNTGYVQLGVTPATSSGTPDLLTWNATTKAIEKVPQSALTISGFVPYTGATEAVNLGENSLVSITALGSNQLNALGQTITGTYLGYPGSAQYQYSGITYTRNGFNQQLMPNPSLSGTVNNFLPNTSGELATAASVALKANIASPTFTGTVTAPTFVGSLTGNAATATNVAWSGITSKPTTIAGYGITDAYTKSEVDGLIPAVPFQSLTTTGTGAASLSSGVLNIPTPDLSGYELLSNKSTSTSLGTSNTLYPTQGAVKAYVDAAVSGGGLGTVTSVDMSVPTGFSVSGNPITSNGTLALSFSSGYSLPTDTKQGQWDTAYGWGNHASAGYAKLTGDNFYTGGGTQAFITTAVNTSLNTSTGYLNIQDNVNSSIFVNVGLDGIQLGTSASGGYGFLKADNITNGTIKTYQMPNASGTLALTTDLGNFVNTTGDQSSIGGNKEWLGNQTLAVDKGFFTTESDGTSADMWLGKFTSTDNSNGRTAQLGYDGLFLLTNTSSATAALLKSDNITGSQKLFQFPNASGTLALTSDLSGYLTTNTTQTGLTGGKVWDTSGYAQFGATSGIYTQTTNSAFSAGDNLGNAITVSRQYIQFGASGSSGGFLNVPITTGVRQWTFTDANGTLPSFGVTAPSSATDTGATGEIRLNGGFAYFCIATNTWVRVAVASW